MRSNQYHAIFWLAQSSVLFILIFSSDYGMHGTLFSMYITLFTLITFVSSLFFKEIKINQEYLGVIERDYGKYSLWGIVIGVLCFICYIYGAGGISGITRNWIDIATDRTLTQLIISNLSQLFYLLSLTLLFFCYQGTKKLRYILMIFIIAILFLALTRVKAYLLPVLFSLMVLFLNKNKGKSFKIIFYGVIYSFFVVIFYLLTTFFRWIGSSDDWEPDKFRSVFNNVLDKGIERNLVEQSTSIFTFFVENEKIWAETYISFLNPILRLFDLDGQNPIYLYSQLLYGQSFEMRGSAHPTLFIDSFANFSVFGVFVGLVWMLILSLLYRICLKQKDFGVMVYIVSTAYAIPLICRGSIYYGSLYLIMSLIFMLLFGKLFRVSVTKNTRKHYD